ncbi:hypothetical protein SISNIDRAFT_548452 [Sistotremastrum niveocremeum HHB9708]|uniref:MYND-type domain-containing protein n=1 Tax=Sistotremastrum niveocremeum HHB9708 TaxID=1314777 RepID=A0A164X369_9AGAM|nr:hypothetical protein SISNIDRAFT_548452 [Sistotremastrum niveocremeum HHB9708]
MNAVERVCAVAARTGGWDAFSEVICRHLKIAVSTQKDLKRIVKQKTSADVVQKLAIFARKQRGRRDTCVLGGIVNIIQNLEKDETSIQEMYKQGLLDFVFQCLTVPIDVSNFRKLAIVVSQDIIMEWRDSDTWHNISFKSTANIASIIAEHVRDKTVFGALLILLENNLTKLCTYRMLQKHTIPAASLQSLQLPRLAATLVAYYQSSALNDLPFDTGKSLFVALMLSPSISIRFRGLIGLLNLIHSDSTWDFRFCNPQRKYLNLAFPPPENSCSLDMSRDASAGLAPMIFPDGSTFDSYGWAMKFVEYEHQGPKSNDESFEAPLARIIGAPVLNMFILKHMESTLRAKGKHYEADVFDFGIQMLLIRTLKMMENESQPLFDVHVMARLSALDGIKRWPERSYFYYAAIKTLGGPECSEWATKGTKCRDITPHLRRRISYELSLALFEMGVVFLALQVPETMWWNDGVKYMKMCQVSIQEALELMIGGSAEHTMIVVLSFIAEYLVRGPDAGSQLPSGLSEKEALVSLSILKVRECKENTELQEAVSTFLSLRSEASKKWSSLISAMQKMPLAAKEAQTFNDFTGEFWKYDDNMPATVMRMYFEKTKNTINGSALPQCSTCHKPTVGLKKCGRCGQTKYCSEICQFFDWKAGHKAKCISPEIST